MHENDYKIVTCPICNDERKSYDSSHMNYQFVKCSTCIIKEDLDTMEEYLRQCRKLTPVERLERLERALFEIKETH